MRSIGIVLAFGLFAVSAQAQTTKIAFIDPLSGGGAAIGEVALKTFQFAADEVNAKGGANGKKLEIVAFDNKNNAQESLVQAQKAIDQGVRIFAQGLSSSVAAAISGFVAKYNERNPGKEVIYLNHSALDPALTNEKCNYWHFRWDAHVDIRMSALTAVMKPRQSIKNVYLINQDYAFGHTIRSAAVKQLKEKRPDVRIVGDELHPLHKITDFVPYIAKIKASGADSVITANWGSDFALLLKAAAESGLQVDWYTTGAHGAGGPTAIKQTGLANRVFVVNEGFANVTYPESMKIEQEYRAKVGYGLWFPRVFNEMRMLAKAISDAKSDDPKIIASRLEGMKLDVLHGGEGYMRADDHQFFQPLYIASFGPLKSSEKFDEEKTGWGWTNIKKIELNDTVLPTTCQMNRPS